MKTIKKLSKRSKVYPYATKSDIYDFAEIESLTKEEVDVILKRLLHEKFISQPYPMAYRTTGKYR